MKKKQKHSDLSEAHLEIAGHWAKSDLMPLSARAHFWRPASRLFRWSMPTSLCGLSFPQWSLKKADSSTVKCGTCLKIANKAERK
jgi:hypothetical protein